MRIGLVLEQFDPARGGREQWTWAFTQRLLELGHEVHVVARSCSAKARQLPMAYHPVLCDPSPVVFAGAVRAVLEPLALDIVHDMGMGWYCDVFHPHGGSMAAGAERKLLFLPRWLRGLKRMANRLLPRHRTFRDLMAKQYADHGQIVLALSRASAADFEHFHDVDSRRIRIVYNGVDSKRFSPESCAPHREAARRRLGLRPDTVAALIVAHNFRLKGVATLLNAMRRLGGASSDLRLLIVGGKHIDSWQRHVARIGLSERIHFAGRVDDPLPYYAAADFYVHPTFYDPCSLVVLEAAACGLPLITSRYNGASEMFTAGNDVLLIDDPADDRQLAAAMHALLDDGMRQRLGTAARRTIMQHSFHRNVDQILEIYREMLESRGGLPHGYQVFAGRISARSTGFSRNPEPIPAKAGTTNGNIISPLPLGEGTNNMLDLLQAGVDP